MINQYIWNYCILLSTFPFLWSCIVNYCISNFAINKYAIQLIAATTGKHPNIVDIAVAAITAMK